LNTALSRDPYLITRCRVWRQTHSAWAAEPRDTDTDCGAPHGTAGMIIHIWLTYCLPPSPRLLSVDGCCFWAPDVCVCPSVSLWVRHLYQVKPKLFVDGTPISPPHPEGWKIKGQVQERENATIVSGRNSAAADRTIYFEYIPKYHHHFILLTHVNKNRVRRKQLVQNIKQLT